MFIAALGLTLCLLYPMSLRSIISKTHLFLLVSLPPRLEITMNTAQKTERTLIHVALLFAPYVPEPDVFAHYVGGLSAEDRAELKHFMTTVTLPILRFMRPEEAKTHYAAGTPELVDVANAFNEAFDGKYIDSRKRRDGPPGTGPQAPAEGARSGSGCARQGWQRPCGTLCLTHTKDPQLFGGLFLS